MSRIRAVLVGVNEYESPAIPSLSGCVNDVLLVRWLLKTCFGVDNEDIHVLVDRRATKGNIVARLGAALERAEPGDVVAFYFSGHGSQIRDRDGDELNDSLDELICPYDMDWDRRTYLIDDDLEAVIRAISPDILLEAFFDCCFWGAGPWEFAPATRVEELRAGARYLPPPVDVYARVEGEEERVAVRRFASSRAVSHNNVVWAASQEGQLAAEDELDGRAHGVFTYYGCQFIADNVERLSAGEYSRERLLDDLRHCLMEHRYEQWPGLIAPSELLVARPFDLR